MFKGHDFVKICGGTWVFDLTEFIGYKVVLNVNDIPIGYEKAFHAELENDEISYDKYISVPVWVLKETNSIINDYTEDFKE